MRDASPALAARFAARTLPKFAADLFTITLRDATVFRWSTADIPLAVNGNFWLPQGPLLERSALSVKNTIEVPELKVKVSASLVDLVEGINLKLQLHNGLFDGARVQLERVFMDSWGDTSLGTVLLFNGRVGQVTITAVGAVLLVKGDTVLMNQYVPANIYQVSCLHAFCDSQCTLHAADFTTTLVVGPNPTNIFVPWSTVPANPAVYAHGTITFLSGPAEGQSRTIQEADSFGIHVSYPLYSDPVAGDQISVFQGCDKTLGPPFGPSTGQSCGDYNNTQNYRGFPFIPPVETGV